MSGSDTRNGALNGSFLVLNLSANTIEIGSKCGVQSLSPAPVDSNQSQNVAQTCPPPFGDMDKNEKVVSFSHLELHGGYSGGEVRLRRSILPRKPKMGFENGTGEAPPEYLVKLLKIFGWRVESDDERGSSVYVSPQGATFSSLTKAFNIFMHGNSSCERRQFSSSTGRTTLNWCPMSSTSTSNTTTHPRTSRPSTNVAKRRSGRKKKDSPSDELKELKSNGNENYRDIDMNMSPRAVRRSSRLSQKSTPTENKIDWGVEDGLVPEEGDEEMASSSTSDSEFRLDVDSDASSDGEARKFVTGHRRSNDRSQSKRVTRRMLNMDMPDTLAGAGADLGKKDSLLSSSGPVENVIGKEKDVAPTVNYDFVNNGMLDTTSNNSNVTDPSETARATQIDESHANVDKGFVAEIVKGANSFEVFNHVENGISTVVEEKADSLQLVGCNKMKDALAEDFVAGMPPESKKRQSFSCDENEKPKKKRNTACSLNIRRRHNEDVYENSTLQLKLNILSWLIDCGIMSDNEKLIHKLKKRNFRKGSITHGGVKCSCCKKLMPLIEFEAHADVKLCQPWNNICLASGKSLMQCMLDAWTKEKLHRKVGFRTIGDGDPNPSDDICGVCGDGESLICCDSCPSTFHQDCLKLEALPGGSWNCPHCTCKFCMTMKHEPEGSGDASTLYTCFLCGCKYHLDCAWANGMNEMIEVSVMFCGKSCKKVDDGLSDVLGVANPIGEGLSWTLLKRLDEDKGVMCDRRLYSIIECNLKLAMALFVLNECFVPLIDRRTGLDMLPQAVYNCGSNFKRLNYEGFYTAVLEKDDEIISVASLRFHGGHLAEMPFIGTRSFYQKKGMCRIFLEAIEKMLGSLNVEKLVIPAVPALQKTWMNSFSFKPIDMSLKHKIRNLSMAVFADTTLLEKTTNTIESKDGQGVLEASKFCKTMTANHFQLSDLHSSV